MAIQEKFERLKDPFDQVKWWTVWYLFAIPASTFLVCFILKGFFFFLTHLVWVCKP